jgi:hypothetical protein
MYESTEDQIMILTRSFEDHVQTIDNSETGAKGAPGNKKPAEEARCFGGLKLRGEHVRARILTVIYLSSDRLMAIV